MRRTITRNFFAFLLVAALCAVLTQPILAYMGGELPELDENAGTDCATSGVCEDHDGADEVFGGMPEACAEGEDVSGATSGRAVFDGGTLRLVHSGDDPVGDQLYGLQQSVGEVYGILTLVVEAEDPLNGNDWYDLLYASDLLPDVENLTVRNLEDVIDCAFTHPDAWIKNLSLPHVRTVGQQAFEGCDSLVAVSLPEVVSIGKYAFIGCPNLNVFHFGGPLEYLGADAVDPIGAPITVYYTHGDWSDFKFNERAVILEPEDGGDPSPDPEDPDPEDPDPDDPDPDDPDPDNPDPEDPDPDDPTPTIPEPDVSASEVSPPKSSSKSSSRQPDNQVPSGPAAVDTGELAQAVQSIAEAAAGSDSGANYGGNSVKKTVVLRFENKSYISLGQLREISQKSQTAGVDVTVHADTKVGNTVVNRLYIDPAKATRGVRLMTGKDATHTLRRFERYTENTLAVLSLDQQGSFGMEVGVAFRLPLPAETDARKLAIYSFNPETGKYRRIFVPHKQVEPGYLWLKTDCAGFIVVSDGPLKRKR